MASLMFILNRAGASRMPINALVRRPPRVVSRRLHTQTNKADADCHGNFVLTTLADLVTLASQ